MLITKTYFENAPCAGILLKIPASIRSFIRYDPNDFGWIHSYGLHDRYNKKLLDTYDSDRRRFVANKCVRFGTVRAFELTIAL